jgi:polysaccharide biosynthesis/export protein
MAYPAALNGERQLNAKRRCRKFFGVHWRPSRSGAGFPAKSLIQREHQGAYVVKAGFATLVAALALIAPVAVAQTADQIRRFQELTPEQRDAAIEAAQDAVTPGAADTLPSGEPAAVVETSATPPTAPAGPSALERRYADRTDVANLGQTQSIRAVQQQLEQFGYDLFAGAPTTFAPATDIPVPADYVIGPGDVIEVQLFGKDNRQYRLAVTRDGRISFPEIGALAVSGMTFTDLRADLERRVAEQMIGVKASISMGPLRSIRVFVLGDVTRPGSYTVSSLSTMTNALLVSGGVQPIGSLRNVQLKRNGRLVTRLDLYDLLLRGDTSADQRLQPGDVIFVPPIGATAAVAGEVRRPAIYELRNERTVAQLVEMAGGLMPSAVPGLSQLERLDARGNVTLVDVNLAVASAAQAPVADGDVLRVYQNLDRMDGVVLLAGHVRRSGGVAWREQMRLADLIPDADQLLPQADLEYVVIRREERPLAKVTVFSTRLSAAWRDPQSEANVLIEPRDQVFVFTLRNAPERNDALQRSGLVQKDLGDVVRETGDVATPLKTATTPLTDAPSRDARGPFAAPAPYSRQALLKPVLEDLIAQAGAGEPTRIVSVGGLVREAGNYPLEPGMKVSDLIRAGGGLAEAAYTLGAEITRYEISGGDKRQISHRAVELARVLEGDGSSDLALQAHDKLTIKRLPEWSEQFLVEVRGEVRFPGSYPIKQGERLSDVLERAGGLTERAFAGGTVFTREELRLREQERIDSLTTQLEADIAAAALQRASEDSKTAEAIATARTLLPQLRTARATGRLVIDLPALIDEGKGSEYDVVLKGGDRLIVPAKPQEVTVVGEVQYPTSHLAEDGLDPQDYIKRSGGLTYKADSGRAYVVRANGLVEPATSGWWIFASDADVKPGDTIVVPLDVERMRPLTLWSGITQIIYQIAVSVAVLSNIGAI